METNIHKWRKLPFKARVRIVGLTIVAVTVAGSIHSMGMKQVALASQYKALEQSVAQKTAVASPTGLTPLTSSDGVFDGLTVNNLTVTNADSIKAMLQRAGIDPSKLSDQPAQNTYVTRIEATTVDHPVDPTAALSASSLILDGNAAISGTTINNGDLRLGGNLYIGDNLICTTGGCAGSGTATGATNPAAPNSLTTLMGNTFNGRSQLVETGNDGAVPLAVLPATVPRTTSNNNFSGTNNFAPTTNSPNAITIQSAGGDDTLFTADTTNNIIKIGNNTGINAATTILQVDGTTADPTTGLAARNGGLYYNSTTNKLMIIENGVTKALCNSVDANCGSAGSASLQTAYAASSAPASITTTAVNKGLLIKAGTGQDSTSLFSVQSAGAAPVLNVDSVNAKVMIANLAVSGNLNVGGAVSIGGPLTINHLVTAGNAPTATATGIALGLSPSVTVDGNDTAGTVTLTTGSGLLAAGSLVNLAFSSPFSATPRIFISPANAAAVTLGAYSTNTTTTGFTLVDTVAASALGITYKFNYLVVQ